MSFAALGLKCSAVRSAGRLAVCDMTWISRAEGVEDAAETPDVDGDEWHMGASGRLVACWA